MRGVRASSVIQLLRDGFLPVSTAQNRLETDMGQFMWMVAVSSHIPCLLSLLLRMPTLLASSSTRKLKLELTLCHLQPCSPGLNVLPLLLLWLCRTHSSLSADMAQSRVDLHALPPYVETEAEKSEGGL